MMAPYSATPVRIQIRVIIFNKTTIEKKIFFKETHILSAPLVSRFFLPTETTPPLPDLAEPRGGT